MEHAQWLYEHWILLNTSKADELQSYYRLLATSMPTKEGSHLNHLRVWLLSEARKYEKGANPLFGKYDAGLDELLAQAELVGLPLGTASKHTVSVLAELPESTEWASGSDMLLAMQTGRGAGGREKPAAPAASMLRSMQTTAAPFQWWLMDRSISSFRGTVRANAS